MGTRTTALGVSMLLASLLFLTGHLAVAALPRPPVARATAAGQDDAALPLALPAPRAMAFELIARGVRDEDVLVLTGFLTAVAGAEDDLLFADPAQPTEATARFAFVAELAVEADAGLDAVRAESAAGTLGIYFQDEAGVDVADPDSVTAGTPIASFGLRTRDVLAAPPDAAPLVLTTGDLVQTEVEPFAHEGTTFRFGDPGARFALTLAGVEADEATEPGRTVATLAGDAVLTALPAAASPPEEGPGPDATPEDKEPEATEEPEEPSGGDDDCAAIVAWAETTSSLVADVEVLVEFVLSAEGVDELEAGQLRTAVDALVALVEQQRAIELPADAAGTNEAIAAALAAVGEAVTSVADAVEAVSDGDLAAAQEELASALDDLLAASADAEALAGDC